MHDFKPVTAGQATIQFTPEAGGPPTTLTGPKPSRPVRSEWKALRPLRAAIAGRCGSTPGLSDRHDLGTIEVFADEKAARADAAAQPPDDPAAIACI